MLSLFSLLRVKENLPFNHVFCQAVIKDNRFDGDPALSDYTVRMQFVLTVALNRFACYSEFPNFWILYKPVSNPFYQLRRRTFFQWEIKFRGSNRLPERVKFGFGESADYFLF
jgi:hypothetical protein